MKKDIIQKIINTAVDAATDAIDSNTPDYTDIKSAISGVENAVEDLSSYADDLSDSSDAAKEEATNEIDDALRNLLESLPDDGEAITPELKGFVTVAFRTLTAQLAALNASLVDTKARLTEAGLLEE